MLFLILLLFGLSASITADPLFTFCSNDTCNYTQNSPFEHNLKRLLKALPSNTSVTGFSDTYVGDDPNRVYGQALCRGDVTPIVCQNCVKNASQKIKECKSKGAIIWYELCQIHYSYQMLSSMMVYAGKLPQSNYQKKNVTDSVHFSVVLEDLLKRISDKAAFNTSMHMFATGENFSGIDTTYGLAQCTRDISGEQCRNCLGSTWGDLKGCCYSRQGGIVLSRSCNLRFEMYPFYNASCSPSTNSTVKVEGWKIWIIVAVTSIPTILVAIPFFALYLWRKKVRQKDNEKIQHAVLRNLATIIGVSITQEGNLVSSEDLPFIDLGTIQAATDNFPDTNKLGQGGFGTVYKGVLPIGKEIAAKRLSTKSWQGLDEFMNEIILISKLQHRNLVRLLAFSIQGEEKLLIYEFMPNKSLDFFIFDSSERSRLDWKTWHNIIDGIARGLLYLHEDSRLKIIHRDLKPSNILLDCDMIAKISDFGMAKIFYENQNTANTRRVVGTHGYMAPEYAMGGLFSVKSDVFSFGVILLEIMSGKRNNRFYPTGQAQTLIAYVWRLWNEGKELEFVDPLLTESCPTAEVVRCIHIGLLCVQEYPADRPTMSSVVVLLGSESIALPAPRKPAFSVGSVTQINQSSTENFSVNMVTISSISLR